MVSTTAAAISKIPLFAGLDAAHLAQLASLMQVRTLTAGRHLILEDTRGEVTFIIQRGAVKIRVSDLEGTEVILAILGPGEVVGEMSLVDALQRSASAVTMEPTTVFSIERNAFWNCLRTMPTMTYNLVRILSRRLRIANAHVQNLATLDVDGRLARQILDLANAYGEETADGDTRIPLRLTQSDLAALVGASRVRVNQVLAEFRRQGYLSVEDGYRIVVHDADGLADHCI